jgi:flavin reductase (DIM6/NTAB) family NADH-FMN oxidoreductase RutF
MFYRVNGSSEKPAGFPYNPFKALIVPRPIGWISTRDRGGGINLAPYSFFNAISATPPMVVLGSNGKHIEGGVKDTMMNIHETGEFVVNVATWELREQMNLTSSAVPRVVDEFTFTGLTPAPSEIVKAPRVRESPINIECILLSIIDLPDSEEGTRNLAAFGRVVGIHIAEHVVSDGMIDIRKLRPIARLGYHDYAVIEEVFEMRSPR